MHKVLEHEEGHSITVSTVSDGGKNTVLLVSGVVDTQGEPVSFDIIDLTRMHGAPKGIRLDSLSYLVEVGLKARLSYREFPYVLPFEGRGKFDLNVAGGIQGSEIDLSLVGKGAFFLVLDLSKMGV